MPANPPRPASSARARAREPSSGAQEPGRAAADPSRPCAGRHASAAGGGAHRIRGGRVRRRSVRWWGSGGRADSLFAFFASPFNFYFLLSFFPSSLLLLRLPLAVGFRTSLSFSAPGCFVRSSRHHAALAVEHCSGWQSGIRDGMVAFSFLARLLTGSCSATWLGYRVLLIATDCYNMPSHA